MTDADSIRGMAEGAISPGDHVRVVSVLRATDADAYELKMASTTHDYWAVTQLESWSRKQVQHATRMNIDAIRSAVKSGKAKRL